MHCARCSRWLSTEGVRVKDATGREVVVGPTCAKKLQGPQLQLTQRVRGSRRAAGRREAEGQGALFSGAQP